MSHYCATVAALWGLRATAVFVAGLAHLSRALTIRVIRAQGVQQVVRQCLSVGCRACTSGRVVSRYLRNSLSLPRDSDAAEIQMVHSN
jgi:hypothetical protein|eukprot:COSAG06_NODE_6385_length_2957_cov_33.068277_4_plen_88_part_00